ncbi:MAG: hypothetical protein ACTSRK_18590 [Promethearchaeota archaeon]
MRDSHYWTAFALNIIIWLASLWFFCLGIESYFQNYDNYFYSSGFILFIGLSFGVYFTFLYSILTNFAHDTAGIPYSNNFSKSLKSFILILGDLFLYLFFAIPRMNLELVIVFLFLNAVLMIIHYIKIKRRAQTLTMLYIRTKKPFSQPSTIIILVLTGLLNFTLLWSGSMLAFFLIPFLVSIILKRLVGPFSTSPSSSFWGKIGKFIQILVITQSTTFISGLLTFEFFQSSGFFYLGYWEINFPQILFMICNIVGMSFYIQFQRIDYVLHMPKTKTAKEINTISYSVSNSLTSPWVCKHCQTTLDPSLFVDIASNIIIYCPYCGQKIYRDEHIPFSKEELLSEHQKVMAKLNTTNTLTHSKSNLTNPAKAKSQWDSEDV